MNETNRPHYTKKMYQYVGQSIRKYMVVTLQNTKQISIIRYIQNTNVSNLLPNAYIYRDTDEYTRIINYIYTGIDILNCQQI